MDLNHQLVRKILAKYATESKIRNVKRTREVIGFANAKTLLKHFQIAIATHTVVTMQTALTNIISRSANANLASKEVRLTV